MYKKCPIYNLKQHKRVPNWIMTQKFTVKNIQKVYKAYLQGASLTW
jgi:hypothetical protein